MPPSKKSITYQSLVKPTESTQGLFNGAQEMARHVEMTPYARREHARQKNRNKAAFDLRPELTDLVDQILEAFKATPTSITPFSKSALVELLMINGVQSVVQTHGDLYAYIDKLLRPTTTPRFDWHLELPPVPNASIIKRRKR
jgi:hypothetical protein